MAEFTVREVTASLLPEWIAFFDHDAFRDNPRWASCYCYFYHAEHSEQPWTDRTGEANRSASMELIRARALRGYLAYKGTNPVGWCNAAPRQQFPNLQRDQRLEVHDIEQVGSIVCFVIAPSFRRQGVATKLLEAACRGFQSEGLKVAEAYPRSDAREDAPNYHGPLQLYLTAGFKPYREIENLVVVRKDLMP